MKQRKRFRKGIITFILLIALVTVQVVQVTALASEPEQQTIPAPDPSNNIRIDAKGADVVFEVKDGVYSISINASEPVQDASASVPETKSSVNWYEVIKIVLLAILVINMLWKPRQKDLP